MKNVIVLMLLCAATSFAIAQEDMPPPPTGGRGPGGKGPDPEKIEAMKIGFITQKLDLTSEEAQKFWPVYNKFDGEMKTLRDARRKSMDPKSFDTMTDKDLEKQMDEELARRQKEVDILKKYNVEFKKVLSVRKVAMLYRLEEEFKRELLKRMQENKGEKPNKPPKGDR